MGKYHNGRYYRGKNDAELQWLEDGVGFIGKLFVVSALSLIIGVFQLACETSKALFDEHGA